MDKNIVRLRILASKYIEEKLILGKDDGEKYKRNYVSVIDKMLENEKFSKRTKEYFVKKEFEIISTGE